MIVAIVVAFVSLFLFLTVWGILADWFEDATSEARTIYEWNRPSGLSLEAWLDNNKVTMEQWKTGDGRSYTPKKSDQRKYVSNGEYDMCRYM